MDIQIAYKKTKDATDAFGKIKHLLTEEYFERFKVKGKIKADAKKKIILVTGTGFTFTLTFLEKEVQGTLELSLLLRALKKAILPVVEKNLKDLL